MLGQFPVIGQEIQVHALSGHVAALAIGLVISLWGGLGVTNAAHNAFDQVWAVPDEGSPGLPPMAVAGTAAARLAGGPLHLSTAVSGLITGLGGPAVKVGAVVISLLVNFGLFLSAFRFMTSATIATSCLWIGVVVAAVFWEILQLVGGIYINHVYRHASPVGAQFGIVIALLVWLHLGAQITLYAAEINVVATRRLWPRSSSERPNPRPTSRRSPAWPRSRSATRPSRSR